MDLRLALKIRFHDSKTGKPRLDGREVFLSGGHVLPIKHAAHQNMQIHAHDTVERSEVTVTAGRFHEAEGGFGTSRWRRAGGSNGA